MGGQNATLTDTCWDIPRLLLLFEGLGENCDFGVVQRAAGIEPFGLFRFAACSAADVALLLQSRFEPLGEPDDLWLEEVGPRREYCIRSRRFSFEAHTDTYAGQDDPDAVRAAQTRKLRFLKAQLVRDLSSARKLLVFKGNSDTETMREITTQLRTYGPNCLLWVSLSDADHAPGSVRRLSETLLQGFVRYFGTYDGDPSLPVADWIAVCANAHRLWRGAEPPAAPLDNLLSPTTAMLAPQWIADPPTVTRPLDEPAPAGGVVLEHRLATREPTSAYHVHLPIASGGSFVFSAWIRIPQSFRGRRIGALLHGFATLATWPGDVHALARGQWQRIWVSGTLPVDALGISCGIVVEGELDDVFHSTSWCLERGTRPLGYGFVL